MSGQKFIFIFLITGIFASFLLTILFSVFWGLKTIYFFISCIFNIFLTFFYGKYLESYLSSKKVNFIVLCGVMKLFLIALFFILTIYFSDRKISTIFLTFLGLLIAPITIRGVSYYYNLS